MLVWVNAIEPTDKDYLLLDRDGVINYDRPDYIKGVDEYQFIPDAIQAFSRLGSAGANVILISNQSALNRGLITWSDFWAAHDHMIRRIEEEGGKILAAFYCPHRPDESCSCRKPSPGMILAARKLFRIESRPLFMIGDKIDDMFAAVAGGCRGILLRRSCCGNASGDPVPAGLPDVELSSSLLEAVMRVFPRTSNAGRTRH